MVSRDKEKNTEDKKNKYCSDILDCIDKYLSVFLKGGTVIGLLASILATISLLYFAHQENVDIFNQYSSWVSSLPIIVLADIFVALFLAALVFFPVFPLYYYLHVFPNKENVQESLSCFREAFKQFIILVAVPEALAVIFFAPDFLKELKLYLLIFILFYLVVSPIIFYYCCERNKVLSFSSLIPSFVSFVSTALFFWPEWSWNVVAVWVIVLGASFVWLYFRLCRESRSERNSRLESKGKIEGYRLEILIYGVVFIIMFITPFSAIIAKGALRLLRVGGGIERNYYVDKDNKPMIPGEFINDNCCIDDFCFTTKLSITWGIGGLIYINVPNKKNQQLKQPGHNQESKQDGEAPELKRHIAIPRNILIPYKLDAPLPDVCKTEEESKKVTDKGQKEQE